MSNPKFIPRVITGENVTVYIDGKGPQTVSKGTVQYDLVLAALDAGDIDAVRQAIDVKQAVVAKSFGSITLDNGVLTYDGRPLRGALVDRILSVIKSAGDAGPLIAFLNNLMNNPSKRATEELFGFLEACDLPITSDGHFLAYKKVRHDYTSVHDGKFRNDLGTKPSMPRNAVDEDKDRTCSAGLHFCSKSYLSQFGGDRIVILKINPADVVAIPSDYNNAKGRAWTYEVVADLAPGAEIPSGFEGKYDLKAVAKTADKTPAVVTPKSPAPLVTAKSAPAATPSVGVSSLTDAQVRDIRSMLKDSWPLASIAKSVGTSARTVARIRDKETYTHVK